jgi:hypothetical protein
MGDLWWEWSYKMGDLWWEWPYKRGDLWREWPYKRGTTTQINTKCVNNNFAYTLIQLLDKNKSEILCLYGVV